MNKQSVFVFIGIILAGVMPVFADELWDVVEAAQDVIVKKYPSEDSIARKMALKELEEIAESSKSDEEIIETIRQKYPDSQTQSAHIVSNNKEQPKDISELIKAAEQGDPKAQNKLGYSYYKGKEVAQDYGEAIMWYIKAAEQGYAEAQQNLGTMYFSDKGVEKNFKEAVRLFRLAAAQNLAETEKVWEPVISKD